MTKLAWKFFFFFFESWKVSKKYWKLYWRQLLYRKVTYSLTLSKVDLSGNTNSRLSFGLSRTFCQTSISSPKESCICPSCRPSPNRAAPSNTWELPFSTSQTENCSTASCRSAHWTFEKENCLSQNGSVVPLIWWVLNLSCFEFFEMRVLLRK